MMLLLATYLVMIVVSWYVFCHLEAKTKFLSLDPEEAYVILGMSLLWPMALCMIPVLIGVSFFEKMTLKKLGNLKKEKLDDKPKK